MILADVFLTGCGEGYDAKDSVYACTVGCHSQKIIPTPQMVIEVKF